MQLSKPDYYNNLDKIYKKIWDLLSNGLADRNSTFHIPVFTCGYDTKFDSRIVVLRGINKKEMKIWFHTDIRSHKIKDLKSNSIASLLFYDKTEKVQLRIAGKVKVNYQNQITEKSWKKTAHMSRQCYLGKNAPGSDVSIPTSGLTEEIDNMKYSIEEVKLVIKIFV